MCERPALAGEALCNGPELELEHRLPTCGSEGSIPSRSTVFDPVYRLKWLPAMPLRNADHEREKVPSRKIQGCGSRT